MLKKLFPLYFIIFLGFFGYSLMITIFTPLLVNPGFFAGRHQSPRDIAGFLINTLPIRAILAGQKRINFQ